MVSCGFKLCPLSAWLSLVFPYLYFCSPVMINVKSVGESWPSWVRVAFSLTNWNLPPWIFLFINIRGRWVMGLNKSDKLLAWCKRGVWVFYPSTVITFGLKRRGKCSWFKPASLKYSSRKWEGTVLREQGNELRQKAAPWEHKALPRPFGTAKCHTRLSLLKRTF